MSTPISTLHQAALEWAASGIPVFPCVADGKSPATEHGFHDATTNEEQINEWWTEDPNYNVAISPGQVGWTVVDVDPGAAALDFETATYTVRTPRGGTHHYYSGAAPSTQSKVAEHVDTRGIGGYVLIPPSIVNGKPYEVIHDTELAPLPEVVTERTRRADSPAKAATDTLDDPGNVARARSLVSAYVRAGDVAIEGCGGDGRTYRLAAEIQNLGLSEEACFEVIQPWNEKCVPPWSDSELRVKIHNASAYAQNEPGAWAVPPAAEAFAPETLAKAVAEAKADAAGGRSRFYFQDEAEQELTPDPRWLIPGVIPAEATVLMYGLTHTYKSFLAQDAAMSIAANVETFGVAPAESGPTFYAANEGLPAVKTKRRRAWKLARDVEAIPDFYAGRAPIIAIPEEVQAFGDAIVERCAGRKPKLIVLDTISKCMTGLNENDAADAAKFSRFCDSLVEAFGCSVIAIGHAGKDETRGHRGSSAFPSNFDTVLEVKAVRATKAVSVRVEKHKDAPEPETPYTFEGRDIANSLVFFPITNEEHRTLTKPEDAFSTKKVGAALKDLRAENLEHAVTTYVLASAMVEPRGISEDQDTYDERVIRAARALASLAKGKLEAYAIKQGRDLFWCLA